jgi:hypothetical protein
LHTLSGALRPGDWLSTFDLQDGYFHLAIHADFQKYFGFRVNGEGFRMVGLPFGWSGSAQSFMQFTRCIGSFLEHAPPVPLGEGWVTSQGIRNRILIDDFLLMFDRKDQAAEGVAYSQALLAHLGVGVNAGKSS